MKQVHIYLPVPWIKALDHLVGAKVYPNRNEAIRFAVRDLLNAEAWFVLEDPIKTIPFLPKYPSQTVQKIREAQMRRDFRKYFWGGGREEEIQNGRV